LYLLEGSLGFFYLKFDPPLFFCFVFDSLLIFDINIRIVVIASNS